MSKLITILQNSLLEVLAGFTNIVINILIASFIFSIGIAASNILANFTKRIIIFLRIDAILEKTKIVSFFETKGILFNTSHFFSWLVKWTGYIVSFYFFVSVLNLQSVIFYLKGAAGFGIKTISAAMILFFGFILANFIRNVVLTIGKIFSFRYSSWISGILKWSVLIFTILFALSEFQINEQILRTFLTALLAMVVLAGGIAFGMAGKSWADRIISKLRSDIERDDGELDDNSEK